MLGVLDGEREGGGGGGGAWKNVDEYTGDWVRAARPGEMEEYVGSIGGVLLLILMMRVVLLSLGTKIKKPAREHT